MRGEVKKREGVLERNREGEKEEEKRKREGER